MLEDHAVRYCRNCQLGISQNKKHPDNFCSVECQDVWNATQKLTERYRKDA